MEVPQVYNIDFAFVSDTQLNSRYQVKYIQETPSRNKIVSLLKDIEFNINNINNILNIHIQNFIQFLKKFKYYILLLSSDSDILIEIQSNEHNTGVKISDINNIIPELSKYILEYPNMCYLEINNIKIIDKTYYDTMDWHIISRNFNSFHQNDDIVRNYIYKYLTCPELITNLVLIGGEMYGFHKLIKSKNLYCYSDFDSIIEDTFCNINTYHNLEINKINYLDFKLKKIDGYTYVICNNGKSGLGKHLTQEIIILNPVKIYIISCNKKSFINDYSQLKNHYNIFRAIIINNIILWELIKNY